MILFNDFGRESVDVLESMKTAFGRVLDSGYWILGPEVSAFEEAWAAACGAKHAIGTGNGLDAIEIALRALDIGPGDEVVTTPMTALATVIGITRAGATPVLADIDIDTALLDPESIQRCITDRTRAMVPVHLYGNASRAQEWASMAAHFGLDLVEDCAQSHLARCDGRAAGTFGAAGVFSFYPTKNLGAIGDAGALVTDHDRIADLARRLRNYGQSDRYHHDVVGLNSRMDELQAALLGVRLSQLNAQTASRRRIARRLHEGITNPLIDKLMLPEDPDAHVHHLFVIRCENREALMLHLQAYGISSLIHYPVPAHLQPPFRHLSTDPSGLGQSERHARTCLSLPCHPYLADAEVDMMIEVLNIFGTS